MKPKLESKFHSDNKLQTENELKRTRRELENTKNALKHQIARCRHLVSAFSKKLAQKDQDLKNCKQLREKQLSAVIRALLILEARLRREQKNIREMLVERDAIINVQRDEMSRLKGALDNRIPHPIHSAITTVAKDTINDATDFKCESNETTKQEYERIGSIEASVSDFRKNCTDWEEQKSILELQRILADREALIVSQNKEINRLKSHMKDQTEESFLRSLLEERESVIKCQQEEILRLKNGTHAGDDSSRDGESKAMELEEGLQNVECYAKPDLISSLCIENDDGGKESNESSTEVTCQPDSLSSDAASTRACLGDNDADSVCNCTITPPIVRGALSIHDRSAFSPVPKSSHKFNIDSQPSYRHISPDIPQITNYPKFSSSQIASSSDSSPTDISKSKTSLNDTRATIRSFDINYQDNPVLQCVNQILLKDPDDIMEDQRSNKLPSIESPFVEIDDNDQPFWLTSGADESSRIEETSQSLEEPQNPTMVTSSPLERPLNKSSDTSSTKPSRLPLGKLVELHHAARRLFSLKREEDGRKSVSLDDLSSSQPQSNSPVLPKPRNNSGKKNESLSQKVRETKLAENNFANPKVLLPPQPVYIDRSKLDSISKPSPLPFQNIHHTDSSEHKGDSELYVISNSALDDEILKKLKGKNLKSFEMKLHRLAGETMMQQQQQQHQKQQVRHQSGGSSTEGRPQPSQKPFLNKAMLNNINLLEAAAMLRQLKEAGQPKVSPDGKPIGMSQSLSHKARLRVAASVAQLLAQVQQQARQQQVLAQIQQTQQQKQQVLTQLQQQQVLAQLQQQTVASPKNRLPTAAPTHLAGAPPPPPPVEVIQVASPPPPPPPVPFKDVSPTSLDRIRVEEPSPQSSDASLPQEDVSSQEPAEETSPCKDYSNVEDKSPGTYDNFLEATGLSQKSIMTPSRVTNNHRSVLKPKDVKLRSKVRNATIFEREIPTQVVGPTIKYYTEPYL